MLCGYRVVEAELQCHAQARFQESYYIIMFHYQRITLPITRRKSPLYFTRSTLGGRRAWALL